MDPLGLPGMGSIGAFGAVDSRGLYAGLLPEWGLETSDITRDYGGLFSSSLVEYGLPPIVPRAPTPLSMHGTRAHTPLGPLHTLQEAYPGMQETYVPYPTEYPAPLTPESEPPSDGSSPGGSPAFHAPEAAYRGATYAHLTESSMTPPYAPLAHSMSPNAPAGDAEGGDAGRGAGVYSAQEHPDLAALAAIKGADVPYGPEGIAAMSAALVQQQQQQQQQHRQDLHHDTLHGGYWVVGNGWWVLDTGCWVRSRGCWVVYTVLWTLGTVKRGVKGQFWHCFSDNFSHM